MMDQHHVGGGHRLFFALWPADEARAAFAHAATGVPAFEDGRLTADEKLHLTLHFLGGWASFPDEVVARASYAACTVRARAFHLVIDHAGSFAGARVGWLAPSGNSGLDALWSDLGRALDAAGIARRAQPRFAPHITVRRDIRAALGDIPIDPISWPVDAFVLVHSHDGRYDVIDRWMLAAT
jgi:2'-5' RNA ligase